VASATDRLRQLSLQVFFLELSSDIIKRAPQPLAYFIDFIALDDERWSEHESVAHDAYDQSMTHRGDINPGAHLERAIEVLHANDLQQRAEPLFIRDALRVRHVDDAGSDEAGSCAALHAAAERYVTLLQAPDKSNGWLVEVVAGQRLRLVPLTPAQALPPGKSMQFWTKLEGASGPTSLGLVQPGQAVEVSLARLPGVGERQLFELTLEPEAGSPLNRPTGPILYVGRSVRL